MICDQVTSKGLLWGLEGGSRKIVLNLKDNGVAVGTEGVLSFV